MEFKDLNIEDNILNAIRKLGFTEPTQIQEKSIPEILNGKDILGESATGSGKTLAFGVGLLQNVTPGKGVQAVVLAPTRELAEQVKKNIDDLSGKIRVTSVYGGVSINPQISALRKAEVVIATPGRMLDHLERRTIDLRNVNTLVLDEADRMLDMGFIDDIERIIRHCPKERQTMFFSATFPPEIVHLSQKYLKDPVKVQATRMVDPSKLRQVYYDVKRNLKFSVLCHLLRKDSSDIVMIFCNTRKSVEIVERGLRDNNIAAVAIHGGFSQNKRDKSMELFKKGRKNVIVCTDVAARGLHIDNVTHIYNYDIPKSSIEYVHRIGRTARAGEKGMVINLLCDYDHDNFTRVLQDYDFDIQRMDKPRVERVGLRIPKQRPRGRGPRRHFNRR